MTEKEFLRDPLSWSVATWALAVLMGSAGGVVNWYARVKRNHCQKFMIVELLGEVFTSGFVGVALFMLMASYDQPPALCAATSGIGGHMSTRLLFLLQRTLEARLMGNRGRNSDCNEKF